jgi:hypothetical protein
MSASNRCFFRNFRLPQSSNTAATGLNQKYQGIVLEIEFHRRELQSVAVLATHPSPINTARHAPHVRICDHPRNLREKSEPDLSHRDHEGPDRGH